MQPVLIPARIETTPTTPPTTRTLKGTAMKNGNTNVTKVEIPLRVKIVTHSMLDRPGASCGVASGVEDACGPSAPALLRWPKPGRGGPIISDA